MYLKIRHYEVYLLIIRNIKTNIENYNHNNKKQYIILTDTLKLKTFECFNLICVIYYYFLY